MNPEIAEAIYDHVVPEWRDAPIRNGHRRVCAPYRDDKHPSLDIHEDTLTWYDRGISEGGGAHDLARRVLGDEKTRKLMRQLGDEKKQTEYRATAKSARGPISRPPAAPVEIIGPVTSAQIAKLKRNRRLVESDTLDRIGAKAVRWYNKDWIGFPALADNSWKLWGLSRNGNPRRDDRGKLERKNAGSVSLVVSPPLRENNPGTLHRLWDVEGESDFLACLDAGIDHVIATTGGAGTLSAHNLHTDWLTELRPAEVVVVRDLDDPGREGAGKACDWWRSQGVAVRILSLPESLGKGGDLRDFLNGRRELNGQPAAEPVGDAIALNELASGSELLLPTAKSACKHPPGPSAVPPLEQRTAIAIGHASEQLNGWESPIPICEAEVRPFPVDALPDWAEKWVVAQSVALQVPADLPGVLLLAVLAAACAKRAHVVVRPGYSEPLNLYTMVALPPASRKSPVFRAAATPLNNVERNAEIDARDQVATANSQIEGLRERARKAIKAVGTASPEEVARCQADADALAIKVAEAERRAPVTPRMLTDDVTPEKLALLLEQHDGVMAVLSPEGGEVFEIARGRYSSNGRGNLSVFLNGHSGDTIRVDRMGRESSIVPVPALTLGLTVQNDVIRDLNAPGFRGRGLLGRFLYSVPPTSIGKRDSRSDPVPDPIVYSYDRRVEALAGCPLDNIGMPLSSAAQELWLQFSEWIEPMLGEYGELGQISDWGGKLAGAIARIAGLLQAAERVDEPDPFVGPVGEHALRCAIELGHYFISHARAAFDLMGADPDVELAKKLLRWIRSESLQTVSKRDAWQRLKGGSIKEAGDLDAPLRILVSHGYLRRTAPAEGTGRRSELYEINPGHHQ